jgi:hypothetical protein
LDLEKNHPDRPNIEQLLSVLRGKLAGDQERHKSNSGLVANIESHLRKLPSDTRLVAAPKPTVTLREGEPVEEALRLLRADIVELKDEARRVRAAQLPKAEQKEKASGFVVSQAPPRLICTHDHFAVEFSGPTGPTNHPSPLAVLAWFDRDALVARLHAEIAAQPDPELALTAAEKRDRLAKLRADLLAAERLEETLIERAMLQGMYIERRRNADPMAVLGVMVADEAVDAAT